MEALTLVSGPAQQPITLEEIKEHLRVDTDHDDNLLTTYIAAVTADVESFMGRTIIDQTWLYKNTDSPSPIVLPKPPIIEVESVTVAGEELEEDAFSFDTILGMVWGNWVGSSVTVRYRAGYVDLGNSPVESAGIPPEIIAAIYLEVGTLYAQRETISQGQLTAISRNLLRNHRVELGMA